MTTIALSQAHKSIFEPATKEERAQNFEDYWAFTKQHSGELFEDDKDLSKKRVKLADFKENAVRSQKPLDNPDLFYRNYIKIKDDLKTFDKKTLLLTCIYKFARHEWVGVTGAWDCIPTMAETTNNKQRISRYHLAEEFCHVRYFDEMIRIFHLDKFEWVPLGPFMSRVYRIFPKIPESIMSPPAFVSELMGITFYRTVDAMIDEIFADEPEACARVRELLHEIMVDEIAHIGQRRNFIGSLGMRLSRWMVGPMFRAFFADIPEAKLLFNVKEMIQTAHAFDYGGLPAEMIERTWIPSYCRRDQAVNASA